MPRFAGSNTTRNEPQGNITIHQFLKSLLIMDCGQSQDIYSSFPLLIGSRTRTHYFPPFSSIHQVIGCYNPNETNNNIHYFYHKIHPLRAFGAFLEALSILIFLWSSNFSTKLSNLHTQFRNTIIIINYSQLIDLITHLNFFKITFLYNSYFPTIIHDYLFSSLQNINLIS